MKNIFKNKKRKKLVNKNMKQQLGFIWKYFKALPDWAKPIVVIVFILLKFVLPDAILIVAVYKYAKYKTEQKNSKESLVQMLEKRKSEDSRESGTKNSRVESVNEIRAKMFTPHYSYLDRLSHASDEDISSVEDDALEDALFISESTAKNIKTKENK